MSVSIEEKSEEKMGEKLEEKLNLVSTTPAQASMDNSSQSDSVTTEAPMASSTPAQAPMDNSSQSDSVTTEAPMASSTPAQAPMDNVSQSDSVSAAPPAQVDATEVKEGEGAGEAREMTLEEKLRLVLSVGEDNKCIPEDNDFAELRNLLAKKPNPVCYDGFEPSGRMHIAQGVMKVLNVNKLTKSGCIFKFWIADWFAQLNNKIGGDLKKIQTVGRYMIEVWKAAGMDLERVEFLWSSEEINGRAAEYWPIVMDIARRNTLARITRCSTIMGRAEGDDMSAGQIFYPCMQCADIFFLKADICQLGNDQVRVNVLAREYCDQIKRKLKPIILSHHMLPGLLKGQEKMSKSDPNSAIFMEDDEADVKKKIKQAYCPPQEVAGNPCIEYVQYVVLPWFKEFEILRDANNGGNKTYTNIEDLKTDYLEGLLHPGDLKPALSSGLNRILQPVRDHFKNDPKAKELLKTVKGYKVTR